LQPHIGTYAQDAVDAAAFHLLQAVADGAHAAGEPARELAAEGVVEVQYGGLQSVEQEKLRLRFAVRLHGAVVIEVIVREIGEKRAGKSHTVHPSLYQTMR